jgi:hypothetical protein
MAIAFEAGPVARLGVGGEQDRLDVGHRHLQASQPANDLGDGGGSSRRPALDPPPGGCRNLNAAVAPAAPATPTQEALMRTSTAALQGIVAEHIAAVNAFDENAIDHHGEIIVRGRYDGDFDTTNLPDELILTTHFTVRDGKIVGLIVIRNTPAY